MKACGVVVEYNPFHNGHRYHVEQARVKSESDVIIAVMSGNFLQRGEPAIMDKWKRTQAALANGVDLVVELPIEWSLQPADYFAQGSVAILQALGCEALCFGTDYEGTFDYQAYGEKFLTEKENMETLFQAIKDENKTYPEKMQQVMAQVFPELSQKGVQPNHILALSYSQQNAVYDRPMQLVPIIRIAKGYHSKDLDENIASATAIREGLWKQQAIAHTVPVETFEELQEYQVFWEDFWPLLKYELLVRSAEELRLIYQMTEGLENRLKAAAKKAERFSDFILAVKSKRYTQTRLQRLCCYVLLGITDEQMRLSWEEPSVHLLGFTSKGKDYLKQIKETCTMPIISKVGKKEEKKLALTVHADQIYALANDQIIEQNFGRFPIQAKNE